MIRIFIPQHYTKRGIDPADIFDAILTTSIAYLTATLSSPTLPPRREGARSRGDPNNLWR
jgi:hypothetical protein